MAVPLNSADNRSISKDVIEAVNLLAHGKRNILCGEVSQAVNQLQEACRILGKEFGEMADECADAYYCYGSALLELHRTESAVFGGGIPGGESEESQSSSEDSSDDDENSINDAPELEEGAESEDLEEEDFQISQIEEGQIRASSTPIESSTSNVSVKTVDVVNSSGSSAEIEAPANSSTEPVVSANSSSEPLVVANSSTEQVATTNSGTDLAAVANSGTEPVAVANSGTEPVATTSSSSLEPAEPKLESKTDVDDDISNLQLAWEMLELSKLIYQRHENKEMKLKLAENYLKLGEIGLETEQFEQAVSDFTKCLELQQQNLTEEDRRIAETFYQLGLAYTMNREYNSAIESCLNAVLVMEARGKLLKRAVAGEISSDVVKPTDGFYTPLELAEKEIEELAGLISDIHAKIDDIKDEQSNADRVSVLMKESIVKPQQSQTSSVQPGDGSGDGPSTSSTCFQSSSVQQLPSQTPVHNITHLVRKKRKSDDAALQPSTSTVVKKIKSSVDDDNQSTTEGSSCIVTACDDVKMDSSSGQS